MNRQAVVVEDDIGLSGLMASILRSTGLDVETIRDGQRAIEWLAGSVPNLIVLDMHLPNVSGKEILSQLRADNRFEMTTVVVVTADPSMAADVRGDVDLALVKPVSYRQIADFARLLR